jgi:protein O-mannosyl-transferase
MPEQHSPKATLTPTPSRRIDWPALACGAVIAAAAFAAYSRTFSVPALFDDDPSIADNPTIRHLGTSFFPPSFATVGGRPVLNLSLAVNYAISGTAVWSYHAMNLAILALAGMTLFGIIRRTLAPGSFPAPTLVAFSAALLWTLHPLQTESVTYMIQRAESLMGLFYLLTLYFFIRGADSGDLGRNIWYSSSIAACLLGMGTKEVMVSAPLIVLLYDRAFMAGSFSEALRRRSWVYAGLAATWIVLPFLVASTHGRGGTAGFGTGVPWSSYALTQFPAIAHYLRLALWPRPLVFDYGTALSASLPGVLPYALVVIGLLGATLWALAGRPALGFLGACFFAVLAPSSSVVPVASEPVAEHRMFLALAPVVVLVVLGIYRWLGRAALPLCLLLASGLFCATLRRNEVYLSDEGIWRDTVAKLPENDRARSNLGNALDADGRTADAMAQYLEALRLRPDLAEAHSNLGNVLAKVPGRMSEAIAQYEEAVRLKPDYEPAHKNLANALDAEGRTGEAVEECEEALRLRPGDAQAHSNLGSALTNIPGRLDDAIAACEVAIRLKPELAEAHSSLGNALARVPGRLDEAIAQCEEAIRLKPGDARAHNNLGNALARAPGRLREAMAEFEEAVRLEPDLAEAHVNLGNALDAEGRGGEAVAQFEEAIRLKPDSAEAHSNLGNALAKAPGRLDEAIAQYREALRLRPDYVSAHNNLGSALNAEGRADEAVAQFEEALRLRPDIAAVHLNLAMALLKIPGRTDEAAAHLREALRLQPGNETARQVLARISPGGQ